LVPETAGEQPVVLPRDTDINDRYGVEDVLTKEEMLSLNQQIRGLLNCSLLVMNFSLASPPASNPLLLYLFHPIIYSAREIV
jgi:hypothetical protein